MLKSFLPLFAMTFFIVLFIVLMQFLWKYIDDLVGKGLSVDVLAELFFYAAVSMVPMALPLAILLASLMTFGNLGEKFELTAMKASGISLLRVMSPLIVAVSLISVGAFFFQNDILPKAQVKMWTLLFSMRQKSPELEIPEGAFYDQIAGYNLYVKEKNRDNGKLYDVMIYDVSRGGDNAAVITADSAVLAMTPEMKHLYLHLWKGEQFENLRDQSRSATANVPFRRESFFDKQILIPFDANFNRMDEGGMRKQYVGKNISELRHTMDSVTVRIDSIGDMFSRDIAGTTFALANVRPQRMGEVENAVGDVAGKTGGKAGGGSHKSQAAPWESAPAVDMDSLLASLTPSQRLEILNSTLNLSQRRQSELEFRAQTVADEKKTLRRHEIELIKKFTLSVACLIFFFIGAPLGAIIRKGGLGTPLVISVLLFLVYYIIDNTGYKMARDGRIDVWIGMWLSTFILAPLGIYVTYKAMNDSAVFDRDRYMAFFRRIFGARQHRQPRYKEVIINDISMDEALRRLDGLISGAKRVERLLWARPGYLAYWRRGIGARGLVRLSENLEETVAYLSDSSNPVVVTRLADYPLLRRLWVYRPLRHRWSGYMMMILFPIGVPVYIAGLRARRILLSDLRFIVERSQLVKETLAESGCRAVAYINAD